jgi:hypothetical protein
VKSALTRGAVATYATYMTLRSGIGLALVAWVTAAATLMAAWRTPGPACACATPAAAHRACCCSAPGPKAEAHKSCCPHQAPARAQTGQCGCPTAGSEPPAVPPRPAADLDELSPFAGLPAEVPDLPLPPAGHPAFGSLAPPEPAPPIDLTLSLARLTC